VIMFFPVFWTIYIPIVTIMLAAAGEWLIHALREFRAQARLARSNSGARRPAIDDRGSVAEMRKSFAARQRQSRK
jgi:hypothetical protein